MITWTHFEVRHDGAFYTEQRGDTLELMRAFPPCWWNDAIERQRRGRAVRAWSRAVYPPFELHDALREIREGAPSIEACVSDAVASARRVHLSKFLDQIPPEIIALAGPWHDGGWFFVALLAASPEAVALAHQGPAEWALAWVLAQGDMLLPGSPANAAGVVAPLLKTGLPATLSAMGLPLDIVDVLGRCPPRLLSRGMLRRLAWVFANEGAFARLRRLDQLTPVAVGTLCSPLGGMVGDILLHALSHDVDADFDDVHDLLGRLSDDHTHPPPATVDSLQALTSFVASAGPRRGQ